MEHINWYPGHMKKTRELIQENLKLVDVCVEVLDARIPVSSRNPILAELTANKIRVLVLNKSDLADEAKTAEWAEKLRQDGAYVLVTNCNTGAGSAALVKLLEKIRDEKNEGRERKKDLRLMIVGIPNVGKSSLINRLTGKKAAKTGNKPGVTRGKQWISLGEHMMMLDTPGIKDEIMDLETLGMELIGVLARDYPDLLSARYKLEEFAETPLKNMENIARKRGFILPGKRIDYERTARTVIDEFRAGAIGRITLE